MANNKLVSDNDKLAVFLSPDTVANIDAVLRLAVDSFKTAKQELIRNGSFKRNAQG